nr:hypothetical protein [Tanacetum cinerariifolium]
LRGDGDCYPGGRGIDDDILLTIKDDILHEKLLNVNLLIAKIEALNANPTPSFDCKTKSSSTSLNSLLEETNTFDNSLPEFETFCFDDEEISSGSTTTPPDISLSEYEVFYDDHVKEISSGTPTTHFDSSLFASFIFDLSINPFPPADRSDSYEFSDELIPFISPPKYDCFLFKVEPNSRDFTKDVVKDISPTKEPQVHNALPTHPSPQLNMKFQPSSESLFTYWAYLSTHPSKRLTSFCYDDDDEDYTFAITPNEPVLSTEEPDNSLSMKDEHLDTILATKSDEFIKSSVENLILIPSESESIPDHRCDVPSHDNSPPLNVSKDQIEDLSESNDEFSSIDDDSFSFDRINYVEASPPDSKLDSDSLMEEIDLFCTSDYPMPPGIEDDYYDSEKDILILKDLPSNNPLSFAEKESFHFDILSFSRPPAKPPDGEIS